MTEEGQPQPTEAAIRARLEELELLRQAVVKFLDQRTKDLEDAARLEGAGGITASKTPTKEQAQAKGLDLDAKFGKLPWKQSNKNPRYEWLFNTTPEGAQLPQTEELASAIRNAGGKLQTEAYDYTVSEDGKFLGRWKRN